MKTLDEFLNDLIDGHRDCNCKQCNAAKIIREMDGIIKFYDRAKIYEGLAQHCINKILNGEEGE